MKLVFIYLASVIILLLAGNLLGSGQENVDGLVSTYIDNSTANLSNNETAPLAATVLENSPIGSNDTGTETQNETLESLPVETQAEDQNTTAENALPEMVLVPASSEQAAFAIGESESKEAFPVNKEGPENVYEIGLPTKPIRDVSKMFFSCNII